MAAPSATVPSVTSWNAWSMEGSTTRSSAPARIFARATGRPSARFSTASRIASASPISCTRQLTVRRTRPVAVIRLRGRVDDGMELLLDEFANQPDGGFDGLGDRPG